MLLRLSRLTFWFAAAVAAMALVRPGGHETLLTLMAGAASLLALGLWRSALHRGRRVPIAALLPPAPTGLVESALNDASAQLARAAQQAPGFEDALHAVARVLRGELGAPAVTVHAVVGDFDPPRVSELIDAPARFRSVPRALRRDATVLGEALRQRRVAGAAPGPIALPVLAGGVVVAAIELAGIGLPIEPSALARLLELARTTLSERAEAEPRPVLGAAPAAPGTHAPDSGLAETSGMLVGRKLPRSGQFGQMPGTAERRRELGFDDHSFEPMRQGQVLDMLNRPLRHLAPHADSDDASAAGAGASAGDAPAPVLDPTALARLAELDPSGANRLLERVLQAFQTSVVRLRPQLIAGRTDDDRAALRLVTHTLKSSSASIGALRLSQLCAEIETAIRLTPEADLGRQLDALDVALDATVQAIAVKLEARE